MSNSNKAMELIKALEAKVTSSELPTLMRVLTPPQLGAAMGIFTASKKNDVAGVEKGAKALVSTMTSAQRPELVKILGEDIVKSLESYK
jgi:hypothetical protein